MPRFATDCPRCKQARRLASFCFAAFALAFIVSAMDDTLDPARQGIVLLCAMMAGLGHSAPSDRARGPKAYGQRTSVMTTRSPDLKTLAQQATEAAKLATEAATEAEAAIAARNDAALALDKTAKQTRMTAIVIAAVAVLTLGVGALGWFSRLGASVASRRGAGQRLCQLCREPDGHECRAGRDESRQHCRTRPSQPASRICRGLDRAA